MRARSRPLGAAGGTGIEAASVRPREDSASERRPRRQGDAGAGAVGVHLALFLAIDEVVVVLHGDEASPAVGGGEHLQLGELPGEHGRGAEIEHLAGLHHVVQRLHRLLDGRVLMRRHALRVAVDHEMVDVVETEPPKARIHALHDVLARQPALVRPPPHGHRDLGRKHVLVARQELAQQPPHHLLASADAVGVGTVEVEQAIVNGGLEDGPSLVGPERPVALMAAPGLTEIHGAETKLRHLDASILAKLHGLQHRSFLPFAKFTAGAS